MAFVRSRRHRWAVSGLILSALILSVALQTVPPCPTAFSAGSGIESLFSHQGLIKVGQRGDLVRYLQEALAACGYRVSADGVFGPATESVVKSFQKDNGLYPDGIAGPGTLGALSRRYLKANPPDKHTVRAGESLSSIGDMYGVSVDHLMKLNRLSNPNLIYAGQILQIKGTVQESPVEPTAPEPTPELPPPPPPFPIPNQRICLTFDDGPDLNTTRPILAILRQYQVKATFFLIGSKAIQHPDLVKEIASEGHVIGVHGFDHKVLAGLPAREVRADLARAQSAIEEVAGVTPWLYRPPFGALDHTQVAEASKLGMRVTMWTNIGGADLGATSAEDVAVRTVSAATDGGIIMLHEGLPYTVEALPSLIEALARLGYGFQNPSK